MLTPEGKWLSVVLRESLQALESTLIELRHTPDERPITMSCSPSFAMGWLTPRLGTFFQKYPQIGLRVQAEFHALDRSRMVNDGLEAAVRFDPGNYPDLHAQEILEEWLVPVASPAFLARNPQLQSPGDLQGSMLLHDFSPWDGAAVHQEWAHWFEQMGVPAPDMGQGGNYNLSMLVQNAACTGQGVALGHSALILDDLAAGRLVPLFGHRVRAQASYFFVCAQSRSDRLAKVEQWLLEQAQVFRSQWQPLLDGLAVAERR